MKYSSALQTIGSLECMRDDLQRRLAKREAFLAERLPDSLDNALQYSGREGAAQDKERTRGLLLLVEAAIERIRDGSYGICQRCDGAIKPKRLEAVPWAEFCIKCAEIEEQEARQQQELAVAEGF